MLVAHPDGHRGHAFGKTEGQRAAEVVERVDAGSVDLDAQHRRVVVVSRGNQVAFKIDILGYRVGYLMRHEFFLPVMLGHEQDEQAGYCHYRYYGDDGSGLIPQRGPPSR